MKVTYNWLKDFVEIKVSPKALAEKLTMAGMEVTSLKERNGDFVFEFEITSNRPDCLSVIGIAREVAAITGKKLRLPHVFIRYSLLATRYSFSIEIENKKDCPLYTAKIIRGVKVGPSPEWLKGRLELIGCRSVNNIVDITNYILFTWGEPLHAFDLDKLNGNSVIVRRAKNGESIVTIDGQQRLLNVDTLVIADKERPVALAGIMGGENTEVTIDTKNVLLEAAIFNPVVIRRARQKLGLQSESSYRFERGVDWETAEGASGQAVQLIKELCGGECTLVKSAGLTKPKKKIISLDCVRTNEILGINIATAKIKNILTKLEFKVNPVRNKTPKVSALPSARISNGVNPKGKRHLQVIVPSHRQDINLEIDLAEEIARIYGYENIPTSSPRVSPDATISKIRSLVSLVRNTLVGLGLNEVITHSLMPKDLLEEKEIASAIEILNPLSQEQEILRPSIIPGLAKAIAYNLNQRQNYVNIFEIAKAFFLDSGKPREELVLGIALCGTRSLFVSGGGMMKEEVGPLHLKGILEALFERMGIKDYAQKEKLGRMRKLERPALEKFDIKNRDVYVAEISLEKLFVLADLKKRFIPLPKYPGISRDISLVLKEGTGVVDLLEAIKESGRPLLEEAKIVDYYKGRQIPAGFKGLTISCLYRLSVRTLTEAEIEPLHLRICKVLREKFAVNIRA